MTPLHLPLLTVAICSVLSLQSVVAVGAHGTLTERVSKAQALLAGAEDRFVSPDESWFFDTQAELREEVARVDAELAALDPNEAHNWRRHLHWHLFAGNLETRQIRYEDLALVRRWLYSNRRGLEGPLFAQLRQKIDVHLDAAYTFQQRNLREQFQSAIALARIQLAAIAATPSDNHAVALARTLDWFDKTGQLTSEVSEIRSLLSQPNAQIVVAEGFAGRVLQIFDTDVADSFPVRDVNKAPPSGIRQKRRTLYVRGTAKTIGTTALEVTPNEEDAEIHLVFSGDVIARCTADAGPAALHVLTSGPVVAIKPILFSTTGWSLGETSVDAPVDTRLTNVTAERRFIRGIARRQAEKPESMAHMRSTAKAHTAKMLVENMDERVDDAVEEIRAEFARVRGSMEGFSELVAPLRREGAVPELVGLRTTTDKIEVNVTSERRHQFGALVGYENDTVGGDIQFRVHLSFFNNSLETILGGKTLSDEFLMRYAKILQAQLPIPLMVHSRSTRWAITTEKHRPLELEIPAPNRLKFTMRITAVDIAGERLETPATATIYYNVVKNDFDEHELVRDGAIQFETDLPSDARAFLQEKLAAFFAARLDAGGVAVPDGGIMGAMNNIQLAGLSIADDWFVLGMNIPQEVFDSVWAYQEQQADGHE